MDKGQYRTDQLILFPHFIFHKGFKMHDLKCIIASCLLAMAVNQYYKAKRPDVYELRPEIPCHKLSLIHLEHHAASADNGGEGANKFLDYLTKEIGYDNIAVQGYNWPKAVQSKDWPERQDCYEASHAVYKLFKDARERCPDTRFAFSGRGSGAVVVHEAAEMLQPDEDPLLLYGPISFATLSTRRGT